MISKLQTILTAISMATTILVYFVNAQTRSTVVDMKIEMLERMDRLRDANDRTYMRREFIDALERRVDKLEGHNGSSQR